MKIVCCLLLALSMLACTRKSEYSKAELEAWWADYGESLRPSWRAIFYRGSDKSWHYFETRWADVQVFFNVPKKDLSLPDERPVARDYHYAVDPSRGFIKTTPPILPPDATAP